VEDAYTIGIKRVLGYYLKIFGLRMFRNLKKWIFFPERCIFPRLYVHTHPLSQNFREYWIPSGSLI
jgi:hypothetical protein